MSYKNILSFLSSLDVLSHYYFWVILLHTGEIVNASRMQSKSLIGYSLLHILFRNLFMRFLLLQHLPCPVLTSMPSLQMPLYHLMPLQQNQYLLKKLQNVQLTTLMRNIGVMMSSGKGKGTVRGDCVSNLHPQGLVHEGVNATLGMMRRQWNITREMSVLIF